MPFPIMNVPPKDGQPVSHVLNIYQVWTLVSKKSNTWLPVHQFALNKKTIVPQWDCGCHRCSRALNSKYPHDSCDCETKQRSGQL